MHPRPTCKIRWIDADGQPTPDDNPAIGEAWMVEYTLEKLSGPSGPIRIPGSKRTPICAEHEQRIRGYEMRHWRFERYKMEDQE